MAKKVIPDEVQVLRFFETGSIERAEAVFNIVLEKMGDRLRGGSQEHDRPPHPGAPRKRNAGANAKTGVESADPSPSG
jgi:hypothetical protein